MSEATVRASIITLVESVTNIGKVYNRQPTITTWDAFLSLFKTRIGKNDFIRGWTISCVSIPRTGLISGGARNIGNKATYNYKIRGYHSLNFDLDTENTFLALAILLMETLDAGIVTGDVFDASVASLPVYQPRFFGDALCHYAEIDQSVIEQL